MLERSRVQAMRSSGTLLCLASAAAFGAMAVFGKLAYAEGATVDTVSAAAAPVHTSVASIWGGIRFATPSLTRMYAL